MPHKTAQHASICRTLSQKIRIDAIIDAKKFYFAVRLNFIISVIHLQKSGYKVRISLTERQLIFCLDFTSNGNGLLTCNGIIAILLNEIPEQTYAALLPGRQRIKIYAPAKQQFVFIRNALLTLPELTFPLFSASNSSANSVHSCAHLPAAT